MATMRAKFQIQEVKAWGEPVTGEQLTLIAVTSKPFDPDGNSEDNSFSRWTPSGKLEMSITNPNLLGIFKQGQKFYLDFTEATE